MIVKPKHDLGLRVSYWSIIELGPFFIAAIWYG